MYQEFYFLCFFNKVLFLVSFFYCKIRTGVVRLYFCLESRNVQQTGAAASLPHGGSTDAPAADQNKKNLQLRHVCKPLENSQNIGLDLDHLTFKQILF